MFVFKNFHATPTHIPIRIICATPHSMQAFEHTQLGTSLQVHRMLFELEIHVYDQNRLGLGMIYNQAIQQAAQDPALLVFVHDDVCILDWFWNHTLRSGLQQFDVVGLAGSSRRWPGQVSFSTLDVTGTQHEQSEHLSGIVAHGVQMPPVSVAVLGDCLKPCKLLDGMFLACDSRMLWRTGLRFDEQFEFHFYDMDFCRQAEQLGVSMGTVPITVLHGDGKSASVDEHWHHMHAAYLRKWES
jgi:hypothetical protein